MENDFAEIMSKLTNAELLEIIEVKSDEYEPEALAAAKNELKQRNITKLDTYLAKREIQEKENVKAEQANIPLANSGKIFSFFFPGWGILFVARALKAEGYEHKYRDIWRYTLFGVTFYILLFIILSSL